MQPSFMQRNPLLAGLATGGAGSWIGNMLFGATNSDAASTTDTGEHVDASGTTAESSSFTGILLILMLLGAGAFYYFLKARRPVPDFFEITRSNAVNGNLLSEPSATTLQTTAVASEVTSADRAAFQQLLTDVQMAWSNQDLAALRRSVTPEMLSYFSTALASKPVWISQIM